MRFAVIFPQMIGALADALFSAGVNGQGVTIG